MLQKVLLQQIQPLQQIISNNAYATASSTTPITLPTYLTSTVTYSDGVPITQNQELLHNTSEKIKVRVEFKKDIDASDLPSDGNTSIVFKFNGNFKQADENACPKATTFQDDDWDVIKCNVKNNPQAYPVGATKEIEMDIDNDSTNETYTLRVANNTTPSECSTEGFSQTACGFVVEFAEIVTNHRMNPSGYDANGKGSKGGWEHSDMRAYLNSTTYAYGNIDYSSTGIYKKLPSALKKVMIDTTVVSGHGTADSSNFTTTDKIYLPNVKEVYDSSLGEYETATNVTRQLDYYRSIGVTETNKTPSKKKYLNGNGGGYWFRTAKNTENQTFVVCYNGNTSTYSTYSDNIGVSPAFRIG